MEDHSRYVREGGCAALIDALADAASSLLCGAIDENTDAQAAA